MPLIGPILEKSAIARFCRTLAITFAAGVPLVEALGIVAGATGNAVYNDAAKRIREDVSVGHQLQLAMQQTNVFPNMVIQMAAIGEEAGSLDEMLIKVAEAYEEEVNNAVDALSSLLEPLDHRLYRRHRRRHGCGHVPADLQNGGGYLGKSLIRKSTVNLLALIIGQHTPDPVGGVFFGPANRVIPQRRYSAFSANAGANAGDVSAKNCLRYRLLPRGTREKLVRISYSMNPQ